MFLHEALDRSDVFPDGILVPQTFGGIANWNPHAHALITDTRWDREGNYYPMPEIDTADLQGISPIVPAEEDSASSVKDGSSCPRRRRQLWAVLLKKVCDVDALKCPKCGGEIKVISFIEQPFVIMRIL